MQNFPNLIIISDGVPSKNGGGISQTLYNLFSSYPAKNLFLIANKNEFVDTAENILNGTVITININAIALVKNRIGNIINPVLFTINCWLRVMGLINFNWKKADGNTVLLVSTTHLDKLHYAYQVSKKKHIPLVTYYMDNWMETLKTNWLTSNIQALVGKTLNESIAVLFISEELKKILKAKYAITQNTLVVHNSVSITNEAYEEMIAQSQQFVYSNNVNKTIQITYAGSIWPMHYDALLAIAKAIKQLKNRNYNIQLNVFCSEHFWDKYKAALQPLGVNYNGYIVYEDLHNALSAATLLLVTSSFLPEYTSFSESSVQTKTTDYMKAGKPIIAIGPTYSACNSFINKWNCGYTINTNNVNIIEQQLQLIIEDELTFLQKGLQGYTAAYTNFRKEVVQEKLYNFLYASIAN